MTELVPNRPMHPVLEKLDKLTYGLIYPAFLGDMIYDIIQGVADNGVLRKTDLYIAILIVVLNALDYMYLFVDMQKLVKHKFSGVKGPVYIFCDIAGSCLFFTSFLLVKYQHDFWAMILIGLVPAVTAIYKEKYYASDADRRFSRRYAISSVLLTIVGACIFSCNCMDNLFLVFFITLQVVIYALYIFAWYPRYSSAMYRAAGAATSAGAVENNTSDDV